MSNEHAHFWLALLELGGNAEERKQNWNQYLALRAPEPLQASVRNMLVDVNRQELTERVFPRVARDASTWEKFEDLVEDLAEKHDGHPDLPSDRNFVAPAVMDFSGHRFGRDVSFAGRLLLFPGFDNACLAENADFSGTVFGGRASFDSTVFEGRLYTWLDGGYWLRYSSTASRRSRSSLAAAEIVRKYRQSSPCSHRSSREIIANCSPVTCSRISKPVTRRGN